MQLICPVNFSVHLMFDPNTPRRKRLFSCAKRLCFPKALICHIQEQEHPFIFRRKIFLKNGLSFRESASQIFPSNSSSVRKSENFNFVFFSMKYESDQQCNIYGLDKLSQPYFSSPVLPYQRFTSTRVIYPVGFRFFY